MNRIGWAIEQMEAGHRVRRSDWGAYSIRISDGVVVGGTAGGGVSMESLAWPAVLATDWELADEGGE